MNGRGRRLRSACSAQGGAELEGAEVEVPDPIVDLFEAHILPGSDGRDVHPAAVPPPDAAIAANAAHFEAVGIFGRGQLGGHLAGEWT